MLCGNGPIKVYILKYLSIYLKQLIEEPTRITTHSSTLLDLIMTNSVNVSKSGVLYSGISDHSLVYVIRKFKRPKSEPKLIKTRSFFFFNFIYLTSVTQK